MSKKSKKSKKIEFQIDALLDVEFSYSAAEKSSGESGYSLGYPGCPAQIEDLSVQLNLGGELIDITSLLSTKQLKQIEEKCFQKVEVQGE